MGIFLACLLGLITGYIASTKGRSFFGWWLYGTLIFIVAIVHVLIIEPLKKCPHCLSSINPEARICKYCQKEI